MNEQVNSVQDIVILGGSGVGRFVVQALQEINRISQNWNIVGFLDDDPEKSGGRIDGIPVIGTSDWLKDNGEIAVVIALSNPAIKYSLVERLRSYGHTHFPVIIHPNTWIAESVKIGEGSIIYPGTSINVGAKIGRFVMVNMNCAIGHDVKVGDYSFLAPNVGVGGNSKISDGCAIGLGASIVQRITVGGWSTVGAGAVLIDDVPERQTVVGVPARPIRRGKSDQGESEIVSP